MKLKTKLHNYQEDGVGFAIRNPYSICAFDMGLGKTLIALGLACKLDLRKILVVCPAFLIPNWKSEIEKFTGEPDRFTVVSYGSLKKVVNDGCWYDLIVCDEVHYAKNLQAKRTELLHKIVKLRKPRFFLGLSGTPVKNRVPEFYSLLKLCWYGGKYPQFDLYSKSYWPFNLKFCNKRQMEFGGRPVVKWEGMRDVPGLQRLLAPIYNRKKDDGDIGLPEQVFHEVLMSDKCANEKALEDAWENYQGGKDKKNFSSAKAVNALAKTKFTAEFVKEKVDEGERFIIFTDHVQTGQELANLLAEIQCKRIDGGTSKEKRHDYVQELNEGGIQALIATVGALSMGVNITGVNHMVFNDYPWSWADMSQAIKRTHRIGQKKTCHYYYILSGKMDRKILNTLKKKEKLMEAIDAKT